MKGDSYSSLGQTVGKAKVIVFVDAYSTSDFRSIHILFELWIYTQNQNNMHIQLEVRVMSRGSRCIPATLICKNEKKSF